VEVLFLLAKFGDARGLRTLGGRRKILRSVILSPSFIIFFEPVLLFSLL